MHGDCSWGLALGASNMVYAAVRTCIRHLGAVSEAESSVTARDSGPWWIARSLGGAVGGWFLAPCRVGIWM